jgi:hypothetical protein
MEAKLPKESKEEKIIRIINAISDHTCDEYKRQYDIINVNKLATFLVEILDQE